MNIRYTTCAACSACAVCGADLEVDGCAVSLAEAGTALGAVSLEVFFALPSSTRGAASVTALQGCCWRTSDRGISPMKVVHYEKVASTTVETDGAAGCRIRCLIGEADGAPSFSMRQFEVAPGGHTPKHSHGHEHQVFVLEGTGVVSEGDREHPLRPGTAVFVPPNQVHQFLATGNAPLKFLCLIPH